MRRFVVGILIPSLIFILQQGTTDGGLTRSTGDQILYTAPRRAGGDIFVLSDGAEIDLTHENADYELCAGWMPDGNQILYAATDNIQGGFARLYIMNADGSDMRPLMPEEVPARQTVRLDPSPNGKLALWGVEQDDSVIWLAVDITTGERLVLEDTAYVPAWSPDGAQLAKSTGESIQLVDMEVGDVISLPYGNSQVAWSPDGMQLAVGTFYRNTQLTSIDIVNNDGTHVVELLPAFTTVTHMVWSPDGEHILVRIGDPHQPPFQGGYFLILVDVATRDYRYLTDESINPTLPSWSPDGSRVAYFTVSGGTGNYDLNIMDISDGTVSVAAERVLWCNAPLWRP